MSKPKTPAIQCDYPDCTVSIDLPAEVFAGGLNAIRTHVEEFGWTRQSIDPMTPWQYFEHRCPLCKDKDVKESE